MSREIRVRVGAVGQPHSAVSARNWRRVRICPRRCPTDIAVPSPWGVGKRAQQRLDVALAFQHAQVGQRRVGGARHRPKPAGWLAIDVTVAGAWVEAACAQHFSNRVRSGSGTPL